MNKKIIIIGFILISIIIGLILYKYDIQKSTKIKCKDDSDCEFFDNQYGKNECISCFASDNNVICLNKDDVNIEYNLRIKTYFKGLPPLCEVCLESDYKNYSCNCINNKCVKNKK